MIGLTFLQPWVWLLAAAIAAPIAIHLLARDRSRQVPFPSLRFLQASRLSAVTRRTLQDWPLLALRSAVILAAVAAFAGPVFVTPARRAAWAERMTRAIVLDDRTASTDDLMRSARPGQVFARDRVRDAVQDALRWLAEQPPATRELVVLSTFQRGVVDAADFVDVPAEVGIRLFRTGDGPGSRERSISRLEIRNGAPVRVIDQLALSPSATEAREIEVTPLDRVPIRVVAPADQQPAADAALRAVLRRGLRLPPAGLLQAIEVPWPGSVEALASALETRVAASLDGWEPEVMTDEELAAMARAPAPNGAPQPDDHNDRRSMWAVVLALVAAEWWLRRGPAWT